MMNNLIIAAAGSGKTTFLVKEALKIQKNKVLITTFTENNEYEIRKKFLEIHGHIPLNVVIQTWFSFLLQHGVKPYQSLICEGKINGLILVNEKSGLKYRYNGKPVYYGEENVLNFYFNNDMLIYSDKLAKFVYKANKIGKGVIIERINRIYPYIFIDEVQDLAGYDLEIIKLLLLSNSNLLMVGDPRQVTYHTHHESKYKKYLDGKIEEFIKKECKKAVIKIDKETLCISHRNNKEICELANQLYPDFIFCKSDANERTGHDGVYFVKLSDVKDYLNEFSPIQLRYSTKTKVNLEHKVLNFGEAKGLTFDRVLIYPTKDMEKWFLDHSTILTSDGRSKLYVALTRAKYSVGIVFDNKRNVAVEGISTYQKYKN